MMSYCAHDRSLLMSCLFLWYMFWHSLGTDVQLPTLKSLSLSSARCQLHACHLFCGQHLILIVYFNIFFHDNRIGAAVLIARYLKDTLVLPDIRGSEFHERMTYWLWSSMVCSQESP